ncbi:hypothetical protein [Streptomyces pacificus]|uniref:Uncharacterized protein n=1 Tax=Streptomyces pacificus TaxID=2705029 RepID=A0A6A0B2R0_9ACTN|nr:hypothetical protein [Streptomyces pacificus]GFH38808.1 hypothetical protein SCWH03_50680 [Streptomyces pacificus]
MSGTVVGEEAGALAARSRALAVLRVRNRALALALLPAAVAVVLLAGGVTGRIGGGLWDVARWAATSAAVVVLLGAAAVAVVIARARPAVSPTVPLALTTAPDLYRLVEDLAERMDVPAPSAIALTPDCDSWLEDRTHRAHSPHHGPRTTARDEAPVLVIGSPFLWWMRVAELRAVLAPVVAGTGPSAHPDIAAARRFVRGLDAAAGLAARPGPGAVRRLAYGAVGGVARALLRSCRGHAAEMERGVAAAASERAQAVDYGLRIVAQEQVGLAYAGWDRLLTRVALPAWRMGRWPSRLDAGVVSALTELSRRDRLAEGFASRLGERPACDLLEEPGAVDEAASLLAARLFHGGPAAIGPDWSPVDWQHYPEEVVDRKWRTEAARLHRVLDAMGVRPVAGVPAGPTLARVMEHLAAGSGAVAGPPVQDSARDPVQDLAQDPVEEPVNVPVEDLPFPEAEEPANVPVEDLPFPEASGTEGPGAALAAGISADVAREEAARERSAAPHGAGARAGDDLDLWGTEPLPLVPLQPPRTARELLADHVTAMVCCAAVDTAGAAPGMDWLDGPALFIDGERRPDLGARVLSLVEDGDPEPLRAWLTTAGVRPEKPVRLV